MQLSDEAGAVRAEHHIIDVNNWAVLWGFFNALGASEALLLDQVGGKGLLLFVKIALQTDARRFNHANDGHVDYGGFWLCLMSRDHSSAVIEAIKDLVEACLGGRDTRRLREAAMGPTVQAGGLIATRVHNGYTQGQSIRELASWTG